MYKRCWDATAMWPTQWLGTSSTACSRRDDCNVRDRTALWREAEIEAANWLNSLAGGIAKNLNSCLNPQANAEALRERAIRVYNWKIEEYNRIIRGE